MNTQTDQPSTARRTRTEPVQQRSADRVTLLLDAAAELIDEKGIDGLTTSDVASRARSSVGVVYRYFPNIQALLRALAARNLERFLAKAFDASRERTAIWLDRMDDPFDAYIDMARNEPGFRALRFGTVIDDRFVDGAESANADLVAGVLRALAEREDGLLDNRELHVDIETSIEVGTALMQRAFQRDRDGDEAFISRARAITRSLLAPYADRNSAR